MIKLILLVLFACFEYSLSTNSYFLNSPCTRNDENTKISCNLSFYQKIFSKISSKFINKGNLNTNKIIENLSVEIQNLEGVLHLKVFDSDNKRYEIPRKAIEFFEKNKPPSKIINSNFNELLNLQVGELFKFKYFDDNGINSLFEIFSENLIFMDDFINFSYKFNSNQIFGYGERSSDFKLKPGVYTIWPNDVANTFEDGKGGKNSYGHQPFFLVRNSADSYIGISFLNSNPQDLYISEPDSLGNTPVNQISIGGIIELLITTGNSPIETLKKYHNVLGKPILPNLWSLGWHQCRWGYKNTTELVTVIDRYNENKIPIDTIWSDIDYMQDYEDFNYDVKNFIGLPQFVENVNQQGIHYVPIIDIGIPYRKENFYYKLGKSLDIFIKSNYTGDDLLNNVWPGICVYPDFTNYEKTRIFWHQGLLNLNNILNFDGIWLDMNEPSGFNNAENHEVDLDPSKNKYANLTYMPGLKRDNYTIETKSLSVNALLAEENYPFNTIFNLKPLNVFYENKITNEYFTSINKRPFILSRSSFTGMGRYSNHWLGDNFSTFQNMTSSIAGIFNFQMFGFNLVGSDICGFIWDTTDELCARWTVLGSFYPFSRNHNTVGALSQEPYSLGSKTLNAAKTAIRYKYSLMRYFYTQLYFSSLNGGVFFQPVFFQFPDIEKLVDDDKVLNQQIMLGDAILFNPCLEQTEENLQFLIPNENWNRFPNGEVLIKKNESFNLKKNGFQFMEFTGKFDDLYLFVRGGYIVPFYDILDNKEILRTKDLENNNLSLIINPDSDGKAYGSVIFDESNSNPYETIEKKKFLKVDFKFDGKTKVLQVDIVNEFDYNKADANLSKVIVYGEYQNFIEKINFLYDNLERNNHKFSFSYLYKKGMMEIVFPKPVSLRLLGKFEF